MKGHFYIAHLVIASTSTERFQAAALIVTTRPSKRKRFDLHVHQRGRFEYGSYGYDLNRIHPDQSRDGSNYIEHPVSDAWEPYTQMKNYNDQFITNDYEVDSNTREVAEKSTPQTNFDIAGIFSQVFPNNSKSQNSKNPSAPRVALPEFRHMIVEDDFQKLTSHAISGGKFVTSLFGDVLFNTAKFAMNALDRNRTSESMEATSYNDVCDFDDELCREIEDALAATENFKQLTEKSRERSLSDFEPMVVQKPPVSTPEPSFKPGDVRSDFAYERQIVEQIDSSVPKPSNKYYFASKGGDSRFSEYYKRSLEQQLADIEVRRSKELVREIDGRIVEPTKLRQPYVDEESIVERNKIYATNKPGSKTRNRSKVEGQSKVDEYTQSDRMRESPVFQRTRVSSKTRQISTPEKRFRLINNDVIGVGSKMNRLKEDKEHHNMRNVNNSSRERNRAKGSIRVHITDEAMSFAQSLNLDVYEVYLSTKQTNLGGEVSGEDEIVTLDDVVWYFDRIRIDQEHVPIDSHYQNDVAGQGYTRLGDRQINMSSKKNSNAATDSHYIETMAKSQEERRVDFFREKRHHQIEREPRFKVRNNVPPTRLQSLTPAEKRSLNQERYYDSNSRLKPSPDERVPRFKQYPRVHHVSATKLPGQRDYREYKASISKHAHYTTESRQSRRRVPQVSNQYTPRNPNQSVSSMSQLVASQPRRRTEYTGRARARARARDSINNSKTSTVSLSRLIQGPREKQMEQVSMNAFREPYQDRESKINFPAHRREPNQESNTEPIIRNGQSSHTSLRELSERYSAPATMSSNDSSTYYTNDALEIAEKYGVDLRNVAAGSDDPISADDVKHYIESRKIIRASRVNKNLGQYDSHIENELTYDEFASYFDNKT